MFLFVASCKEDSFSLTEFGDVIVTRQDDPLPLKPDPPPDPTLPEPFKVQAVSLLAPGTDSLHWETGNFSSLSDPTFRKVKAVYSPDTYTLYMNRQTRKAGTEFTCLEQLSFTYRHPKIGSSLSSGGMLYSNFVVVTKNKAGTVIATNQAVAVPGTVFLTDYDESRRYLKGFFEFKARIQLNGEPSTRQFHFKSDTLSIYFN